jgi:hypothetical protein
MNWTWNIWASPSEAPITESPTDPRAGDQWIRGERWYVWNGRQWKIGPNPTRPTPKADQEQSE